MTHSLVITTDTDQPNKVNGYVVYPAYGENFPVVGTRESGEWKLRAGISDEYRAKGSSLRAAARRLAKEIGIAEGTVAIGSGIIGQDTRYDVRTGRELPKTSVREIPITIAEYMADEPEAVSEPATEESAPEVDSPAPRFSLPFEPAYYPNDDGGTDIRDGNGELQ